MMMTATATPLWAIAPFILYLLLIAIMPLFFGAFWEHNRNKFLVAVVLSAPVVGYLILARGPRGGEELLRTACDYASFMALLGALFTISGGICLRGSLAGAWWVNLGFLAVGAVLGSIIGTTGASVLLIRPLLRANARRGYVTHIVVFFIFIVSNAAGLLTPLGDPPLFLGFLRGVPFTWTLRLLPAWAMVNGILLAVFSVIDRYLVLRERRRPRPAQLPVFDAAADDDGPLHLDGGLNFVWLLGIVAFVFSIGSYGNRLFGDSYLRSAVQVLGTVAFGALSFVTTARQVHERNRFSWGPIIEVAVVFVGVFLTMVPALSFLAERGASLGIVRPAQFFWASGALSSVLDNAPTYLTFASLATGVVDAGAGLLSAGNLGGLAAHPTGQQLLVAVSCGSVMMGAVTYIGNGPNFMVKAIAEQHRVRMPGFFGYVLWSFAILIPIFGLVSHVFF
jgi:Na+/H+ antiporter NhaD/arsenite permease-like protein